MVWLKRVVVLILFCAVLTWLWLWSKLHTQEHQYAQLSTSQMATAKAYLEGKLTPALPDWQWNTFYPEEGVNLRTGTVINPNARGLVVVVPGFTGTIEMVMREINQFYEAGFSVAAIEYRGQGASWRPLAHPEKGYVEDYAVLAQDIAKYADSILEDEQPLFFYSISKGAHITLRMAMLDRVSVAAYSLIVPMVKINTGEFSYSLTKSIANVFTTLGLGAMYAPGQTAWPGPNYKFGEATGCNANPELAQSQGALFAVREELRTSGTTMRWLKEAIDSTQLIVDAPLNEQIDSPVLMFTAGIDELVDTSAAQNLCATLNQCELIHKPDSRHCITREDMTVYDGMIQDSIRHFNTALNGVN